MARVEIPAPGDLVVDAAGNVLSGRSVTLKLAGTATNATHYSALTGGTSTTGGLVTHTDGTIVDGSGNRRYVDSGASLDLTILGRTRQIEPQAASVSTTDDVALVAAAATGVAATDTAMIQAKLTAAAASGATEVRLRTGAYSFTNLTLPVLNPGALSLVGEGIGKTVLTCTGTSGYAITFGDAGVTDAQRAYLRDMTVIGNANMDGGVRLSHSRFTGLERVKIQDFTKAGARSVSTTSGGAQAHNYFCVISHCQFRNSPIGIALTSSVAIGGNSNYIEFCHFGVHTSQAVLIDGGAGNVLLGNEFNGSVAIGVRLQSAAQHNKLIGNQFDGPTLTVDLDPATVLDTNLIGNTSLATVTTSGVALTGAQYLSTRTCRIDSTGAAIPSIIQGGIEVGNYSQTNPTDGIGVAGDVRSDEKVGADYASSGEVRIGAVGPASEAAVQFNRTNTGTTGERLYLSASSIIRTGGKLAADAGIGVGNSAAATEVIGKAVVKKIQVFDAAGTSLGFIPVYSSIT